MLFLNHYHPIITAELIDTNESEERNSESNEDEEEAEKRCPNVVSLDDWNEFLKSKGIDEVSDREHFND
jgi:hypothetical protein